MRRLPFTRLQIVLTAVLLAAGFLVAWQLRIENLVRRELRISSQRLEELAFLLEEQARYRERLEAEIASLRDQLAAYEDAAARDQGALLQVRRQLRALRLQAGLEAVAGPGVVVEMRDSLRPLQPGDDPNLTIIHYTDIHAVVAALWAAGAEAVALNGERIVASTGLSCVGTTILCNAKRIAPPYVVTAIGDPGKLYEALTGPGSPVRLLRAFDFPVQVTRARRLVVPAYRGGFRFSHVRPDTSD
ncbi:MAG: DUF881 domain-containing protein [Armatimonadota bacterium]|nr:DUF881 domain-containing protein [Armatimonadota bacterium]MDR5696234.1 DUF881 domain-containing protein [Armatimonadota bacterium]